MFAIPGLIALLAFVYIRPQEVFPALQSVPFLHLFALIAFVGWVLDVRLKFTPFRWSPLLIAGGLYFAWTVITLLAKGKANIGGELLLSAVSCLCFLIVSQTISSFRGLRVIAGTVLGLSLFIATVAVHQRFAPQGCVKQYERSAGNVWVPIGRRCETRQDCYVNNLEDNVRFRCERVGLLGTTSIEGRVRYRGIMEDPNELALVMSVGLPFAFALFQSRRTIPRFFLAAVAVGVVGLATIFTQSRSGQLAFVAVLATYLFKRVGWTGFAAAGLLGAPVLLLGGRSGGNATASSLERLECWQTALELFSSSPLLGVGKGQFTEYHPLTAHNSFMLALAEEGAVGLLIWTSAVYLAFKIAITILRAPLRPEGRIAAVWATATLSALCGLMMSSFFLSFSDHHVFWIIIGLAGGLYAAARRHMPGWRLAFARRDLLAVVAIDVAVVTGIFVYTKIGYELTR